MRPYQPKERLGETLGVGDVHLVSLDPALEGLIVPSKFYGIAAAGRPTIFIGNEHGEIARLLESNGCGFTVPSGDGEALANETLSLLGTVISAPHWRGRASRSSVSGIRSRLWLIGKIYFGRRALQHMIDRFATRTLIRPPPSGASRSANATEAATTLSVRSSGVVLTAIFGGAEDAPSNRRTHNSGRNWIAEETLPVIFPDQGLGGAWRLLADANNPSRDDAHLASAWIDELRAAPGVRHQQVAGVCFYAACRRLKSVTAVDQDFTFDRIHGSGEAGTLRKMSKPGTKNKARRITHPQFDQKLGRSDQLNPMLQLRLIKGRLLSGVTFLIRVAKRQMQLNDDIILA